MPHSPTPQGAWVFYTELMTDMLHLLVYLVFFMIVFTHYGLPLHLVRGAPRSSRSRPPRPGRMWLNSWRRCVRRPSLALVATYLPHPPPPPSTHSTPTHQIRDLYITFRNFRNRISDFLRFRQVTARMDRFPDATADDLARCHFTCVVCRDEMHAGGANKRLACGHVFHLHCLRSWLERSQSCPTCRTPVFRPAAAAAAAAAAAGPGAAGGPAAGAPPGAGAAAAGAADGGRAMFIQARLVAGPDGQQRLHMLRAVPAGAPPGADGAGAAPAAAPGAAPAAAAAAGPAAGTHPAAAGTPAAVAAAGPAAAHPGAYWHPGAGALPAAAGVMWPQWYPVTSMAAFANAPLQYASQQHASQAPPSLEQQAMAAGMVPLLPMVPAISAPFSAVLAPQLAAGASPEQQAAAAAMAAAAAAMYATPMAGLAMMPPAMLPPALLQPGAAGHAGAGGGGAGGGGFSPQEQAAVTAATAAANAAAAAAAMMAGSASPEVVAGAMEATQQVGDGAGAGVGYCLPRLRGWPIGGLRAGRRPCSRWLVSTRRQSRCRWILHSRADLPYPGFPCGVQMLRRQLEYVQSQMDRIRSSQASAAGASGSGAPGASGSGAAGASGSGGASGSKDAAAAAAAVVAGAQGGGSGEASSSGDTSAATAAPADVPQPAAAPQPEAAPAAPAAAEAVEPAAGGGAVEAPVAPAGGAGDDEAAELRRRRLARFGDAGAGNA
jgi:hypothetical protein